MVSHKRCTHDYIGQGVKKGMTEYPSEWHLDEAALDWLDELLDEAYKHANSDAQLAKHTRARQLVHLMHAQIGSIPSDERTDSKV